MNLTIEILDSSVKTDTGKNGKSYSYVELAYKRLPEGKVEGKKIMSFTVPEVYKSLVEAKKGTQFEVTTEKDAAGYWQWLAVTNPGTKSIYPAPAQAPEAAPKAGRVLGNTYETPEERALRRAFEEKKQHYIVRQSSLSNAIEFNPGCETEELLELAEKFYQWVYNVPKSSIQPILDMPDDLPT